MLDPRNLRAMYRGSGMVMEITVLVGIAAYAGNWVDEHLSSSPLLLMIFSIGALAAGMFRLIRALDPGPRTPSEPHDHPGSTDDGDHTP